MACFPAELVMSLTGLSAYQGPASRFSPVSRIGRYSADHPAGQPLVGVGPLSGCPLFHPPEGGAIASQAESGATSSPSPVRRKWGRFRPLRANRPQITMSDLVQLSPRLGGTAGPESGPVCARRSDRRVVGPTRASPSRTSPSVSRV